MIKGLKRTFAYLLCLSMMIGMISIHSVSADGEVSAKVARASVEIGKTIGSPFNAPTSGVTYTSSDNNIATVAPDGKITGISLGSAKITATMGTVSASCQVSVGYQTGLDVSSYQGKLDWKKVKQEGIEFVFIRVATGKTAEGSMDTQLLNNVKGARENGIPYGFYFYSYATSVAGTKKEAQKVLDILAKLDAAGDYAKTAALPVVFDIEDSSQAGLGKTKLTNMTKGFLDTIREAGYSPMVYANQNWYLNYLDLNTLISEGYTLWLARWPDNPNFSKKIKIGSTGVVPHVWQYTSSGTVAGQRVDMNVMYYDTMDKVNSSYQSNVGNMGNLTVSPIESLTYNGAAHTPAVTVFDGEKQLVQNIDYTLTYTNNINAGTAVVSIDGMGEYFGTRTTTFTIQPKAVEITIDAVADQPYAAEPIIPTLTVKTGETLLQKDIDYTVAGANNTELGTATLTITCIGNYSGGGNTTFNIIQKELTEISVGSIKAPSHTGGEITPEITAHNGTHALILGTDYTVEYKDNVGVGTATITLTGIGNYTGSRTVTFSIVPKTITSLKATVKSKSKIALSWAAVSGATGYEIYDNATKKIVKTVSGSATSTNITKLAAGSVHNYKIRAFQTIGDLTYTAYYSPLVKRATTPEKVKLTAKKKAVNVKWKKSKNSSGYELQYAYNAKMKGAKKLRVLKASTVKKTIKKLTSGKTVYVRIRVVTKQNGKLKYSPYSAKRKIKIK